MLDEPTVFVIGAGASSEVGLPLGAALRHAISASLRHTGQVVEGWFYTLCQLALSIDQDLKLDDAIGAANQISKGINYSSSVDSYLQIKREHKTIIPVAKAAIANIMIESEAASRLSIRVKTGGELEVDMEGINKTWYPEIAQIIFEGVPYESIASSLANLTLIVFNYDRCVEFFLFRALRDLYSLGLDEAVQLYRKITIIHPYGMLGPLPETNGGIGIEFGGRAFSMDISQAALGIKTFSEAVDDSVVDKVRGAVCEAQKLVFLGSAFHEQNFEMLTSKSSKKGKDKKIFGTVKDMSSADIQILRRRFRMARLHDPNGPPDRLFLEACTCAEMLGQYKRSIMRANAG